MTTKTYRLDDIKMPDQDAHERLLAARTYEAREARKARIRAAAAKSAKRTEG